MNINEYFSIAGHELWSGDTVMIVYSGSVASSLNVHEGHCTHAWQHFIACTMYIMFYRKTREGILNNNMYFIEECIHIYNYTLNIIMLHNIIIHVS